MYYTAASLNLHCFVPRRGQSSKQASYAQTVTTLVVIDGSMNQFGCCKLQLASCETAVSVNASNKAAGRPEPPKQHSKLTLALCQLKLAFVKDNPSALVLSAAPHSRFVAFCNQPTCPAAKNFQAGQLVSSRCQPRYAVYTPRFPVLSL